MTLVRWNPARELASMEIDRLNHMINDFYGVGRSWMPAVDIFETNDREYVVKAELPDMKRDDISVTFENGVLTLTGERKAESTSRRARSTGASAPPAVSADRSRCRQQLMALASMRATRMAC